MKPLLATLLLTAFIIVIPAGRASALPWKRHKRVNNAVMRYDDGCRNYCKEYDGCKRCFGHSRHGSHYVAR